MSVVISITLLVAAIALFILVRRGSVGKGTLELMCRITALVLALLSIVVLLQTILKPDDNTPPDPPLPSKSVVKPTDGTTNIPKRVKKDPGLGVDAADDPVDPGIGGTNGDPRIVYPMDPIKPVREWKLTIWVSEEVDYPYVFIDDEFIGSANLCSLGVTEGLHEVRASYTDDLGLEYHYSREIGVSSVDTLRILRSHFSRKWGK